jgi:FlaA1/EpsC-like NDP-sugar epimerase
MSISVLIIGAGGAFGQPLLQEFIRQKSSFKHIAVLATSEKRAADFAWIEATGLKIVVGSFLESKSYQGSQ